jgi:hypothetical protein
MHAPQHPAQAMCLTMPCLCHAMQAAEARVKQLQSAQARKDTLIKDLKDRLEGAVQVQAAAAASSQAVAAAEASELERCKQQLQKLRSEALRKEAAVRGLQAELEGSKRRLQQLEQEAAADQAAGRQAAAAGRQASADAGALRKRATQLLQALRAVVQMLLHCTLSMRTASQGLTAAPAAAAGRSGRAADESAELLAADDIAALVDLSEAEVRDLLGGTSRQGRSHGSGGAAAAAAAVVSPLKQQAEEVMAALETAVSTAAAAESGAGARAAAAAVPGAAGGFAARDEWLGKDQAGLAAGRVWDSQGLLDLIGGLQGEVQAAQALLASAAA